MITKVYNFLKTIGLPLEYNFRPRFGSKGMAISYHLFNEVPEVFEDGEIAEEGGSLQVDLFVKHTVDFCNVKKQIKQALKKDFMLVNIETTGEDVDGIGMIDHVKFIFNYVETEE